MSVSDEILLQLIKEASFVDIFREELEYMGTLNCSENCMNQKFPCEKHLVERSVAIERLRLCFRATRDPVLESNVKKRKVEVEVE